MTASRCVPARLGLAALLLVQGAWVWAGSVALPTAGGVVDAPIESMRETQFRAVVRQRYDFSCGSAAVATLLTYHYDAAVSEADVFMQMWQAGDQDKIRSEGFSLLDMKRYLDDHGFPADGFRVPLDQIRKVGVSPIVLINDGGYMHFVVIKGVNDRFVLLGDPAKGVRRMERAAFKRLWDGLVFVVRDRLDLARRHFNRAAAWKRVADHSRPGEFARREDLSEFTLALPRRGDF